MQKYEKRVDAKNKCALEIYNSEKIVTFAPVIVMKRIKKKIFLSGYVCIVLFLGMVKACSNYIGKSDSDGETAVADSVQIAGADLQAPAPVVPEVEPESEPEQKATPEPEALKEPESRAKRARSRRAKHPIRSVVSYAISFPDKEDVHMDAALYWGVKPIENRDSAEQMKDGLVYAGSDPFYMVDPRMKSSIPYLVPRAQELLREIGHAFMDSLSVKGVPMHRIIVSSMLRTEEDVRKLRKVNVNASPQSCHRYGTTFDVCYNRYDAVNRPVRDDTLKYVLSEVLRDKRMEGRCYIKYEVKQGCFHITCR